MILLVVRLLSYCLRLLLCPILLLHARAARRKRIINNLKYYNYARKNL